MERQQRPKESSGKKKKEARKEFICYDEKKRNDAQMENLIESKGTKSYKQKTAVKRLQFRETASTVSKIQI